MQHFSRVFNVDIATFVNNTRNRVLKEVLVFALLAGLLFSPVTTDFPMFAKFIILLIVLLYIIYGIVGYSKAKLVAESMKIRLTENQLEILGLGQKHFYPYDDINILKIKKSRGMVKGILLNIKFVGKQWLTGFEDMDLIYKLLQSRLKGV